jgi:hypothetical protein
MNCSRPRLAAPLFLFLALLASACAPKQPPVLVAPPPETAPEPEEDEASRVWRRFAQKAAAADVLSGPFRASATLRYTDQQGKNQRVSALLWSNNQAQSPWPLRLDLTAGVGTVVAKAREDQRAFSLYVPDEESVYTGEGGGRTLASFGVPVPLSLSDLTLLLTGRAGALFLPRGAQGEQAGVPEERGQSGGGAEFTLRGVPLPGILTLAASGVIVSWREARSGGWRIDFEPDDKNPMQPRRLRINHGQGWSARVVVRELARVSPPYSEARMALDLPPGTVTKPLAE